MEIKFDGKRALVTGASQGIGRDIAIRLAQCGANVIAIARNKELLDSLSREHPNIQTTAIDVSKWDELEAFLQSCGPIDLCVNNAAVALLAPIGAITESDITSSFDLNVKALIHCTQFVAESLKSRKAKGAIVNVSSQASQSGLTNHGVYCATKAAVDGFTRAAAIELGPYGIRVNSVNPTVIMTAMGRIGWSQPEKAQPMLAKIPLGRFGEVEEVTDAVLFLLSEKASMISGSCLAVDGGFLAG